MVVTSASPVATLYSREGVLTKAYSVMVPRSHFESQPQSGSGCGPWVQRSVPDMQVCRESKHSQRCPLLGVGGAVLRSFEPVSPTLHGMARAGPSRSIGPLPGGSMGSLQESINGDRVHIPVMLGIEGVVSFERSDLKAWPVLPSGQEFLRLDLGAVVSGGLVMVLVPQRESRGLSPSAQRAATEPRTGRRPLAVEVRT